MADVGVRHDLGDDGAEGEDGVLGITIALEIKVDAERDGERGALLGGREREELGDLEPGLAFRAVVALEDRVRRDGLDLLDGVREEQAVRSLVRQRVRVLRVILH